MIMIIYNHYKVDDMVAALKDKDAVTRVDISIYCPATSREIVLTDKQLLDTFGKALMQMKETDVIQGGAYTLFAKVIVYKKNKEVEFFVQESPYNGWMIIVFNRSYESNFIFNLVRGYCRQ